MLFMVIETYRGDNLAKVGERFRREGRLLPEGVEYLDSWMNLPGTRCFQLMEAPRIELLHEWTRRWEDLVEFEIVPVMTSVEFWAKTPVR
jgi:uncharacterized protein DUF3303